MTTNLYVLCTSQLFHIRLVIISLVVMSLSFSAQANDELQLELKGQPYTTDLIDDYNGKCEQFVRDSGFSVGMNTKPDGGLFYIQRALVRSMRQLVGPNMVPSVGLLMRKLYCKPKNQW